MQEVGRDEGGQGSLQAAAQRRQAALDIELLQFARRQAVRP